MVATTKGNFHLRIYNGKFHCIWIYTSICILQYLNVTYIPPPPQKWPYLHERCSLCWTEWKINFPIFDFLSYGCLYLQFSANTLISKCVTDQNKFLHKWPKLHERCAMCWSEWKINFAIFSSEDMIVQKWS